MENIFDQLTSDKDETINSEKSSQNLSKNSLRENDSIKEHNSEYEKLAAEAQYTPKHIKAAAQDLMKFGIVEAFNKPTVYKTIISNEAAINGVLEPLDLKMKIDDIRGLSYIIVEDQMLSEKIDDEWTHPLVRKQRLNLEQSLLIAILRKHFIAQELEAGMGGIATAHLDELLPELNSYLGELGSEMREDKRLRNLLEQLKGYGLVTEINKHDQVTIRPLIAHVANPENLKNLLADFITAAKE